MKLKIISTLIVSFLIVTVKASTLLPIFTILPTPVCQVSVTQTASGWAQCSGSNTVSVINTSGSCTRAANSCDEAYVAARDCAISTANANLQSERQAYITGCKQSEFSDPL